tara:strand:+ start:157 stop:351 length:195 start_codon:yes stop_codon:yes gene_type:complete
LSLNSSSLRSDAQEAPKVIVLGRILVERLIRHVMRTYLDAGFVSTFRAWIRNQLEMVEFTTPID